ncbi:hypothetical protein [Streptococcus suis]
MRRFRVNLPQSFSQDILYVSSEIERLRGQFEGVEDEASIEKRHLILLIATFTEQALKSFRNEIVNLDDIQTHVRRYFEIKNSKEPLYVKVESANSIFKSFDKTPTNFTMTQLAISKKIVFFEDADAFKTFEDKINKARNKAAHETQPNLDMSYQDIRKFYDYSLLFLEHYYHQILEIFNISIDSEIYESIDSYSEYFVSNSLCKLLSKESTLYRLRRYRDVTGAFKEEFDKDEWEWIFRNYFIMSDTEKQNNSILKPEIQNELLQDLVEKISEFKTKWEEKNLSYQVVEQACEELSNIAEENREAFNFPIRILGNKIRWGR